MRHSRLLAALCLAAACRAQVTANPQPAGTPGGPVLNLTLKDALDRARQYGPQFLQANIAAQLAHQDTVQAKAALLPTVNGFTQFIYTQPNGTDTGVFVASN